MENRSAACRKQARCLRINDSQCVGNANCQNETGGRRLHEGVPKRVDAYHPVMPSIAEASHLLHPGEEALRLRSGWQSKKIVTFRFDTPALFLFGEQLHSLSLFLEAVGAAPLAQFEQGELLGGVVYNHQGVLLGKALHFYAEGLFGDGEVYQQAVVEVDRCGVARKALFQDDGVGLQEVALGCFLPLEAHAHVDEDDDDEDNGEGEYAVAYHKLLVGVEAVDHGFLSSLVFEFFSFLVLS